MVQTKVSLTLMLLVLIAAPCFAKRARAGTPAWTKRLGHRMLQIEAADPGRLGLYVKDLSNGEEFSFRAKEYWYIASGVKLPIAVEVLRQAEQGNLSLSEKLNLESSDYVDGAGLMNHLPPGSRVSVETLMREMLIHSDNTASDLLIRRVGLGRINDLVTSRWPGGFGRITTLLDVRRNALAGLHPATARLNNLDFLNFKSAKDDDARMRLLLRVLNLNRSDLRVRTLDGSYSAYYSKRLNSAKLTAYARLLEDLVEGRVLGPERTKYLLNTLAKVETGQNRVKAGLPAGFIFAHKTGTQRGRICDFGIIWNRRNPSIQRVVVAACTRDFSSKRRAENALRRIGEAVSQSGLFRRES